MIHVYAFAEGLEGVPPLDGLDGAALERLRVDDVDVVFSLRSAETSADTLRRDAVAHGAVVDALRMRAAAVVPVRFGELLADDVALTASLRERLPTIHRAFDRVRNCVEVAVRVLDRGDPVDDRPESGTAYMQMRAIAESRRRRSVDDLQRELRDLACDVRVERRAGIERDQFAAAYLVASERIEELRGAVERFAASHEELAVVCTGPWAPFSFVEDAA